MNIAEPLIVSSLFVSLVIIYMALRNFIFGHQKAIRLARISKKYREHNEPKIDFLRFQLKPIALIVHLIFSVGLFFAILEHTFPAPTLFAMFSAQAIPTYIVYFVLEETLPIRLNKTVTYIDSLFVLIAMQVICYLYLLSVTADVVATTLGNNDNDVQLILFLSTALIGEIATLFWIRLSPLQWLVAYGPARLIPWHIKRKVTQLANKQDTLAMVSIINCNDIPLSRKLSCVDAILPHLTPSEYSNNILQFYVEQKTSKPLSVLLNELQPELRPAALAML